MIALAALGALAALSPLAPPPAFAHLGHIVLNAERYLKIEASDVGARVVVSLSLGPTEARRILEAADANADGDVSQAEADAYLADWGRGLATDLPVEVDGAKVEPIWADAFFEPIGPIGDARSTVEMVGRLPLPEGQHRIAVHDRMRREAFDRTDVAFRARESARLIASGTDDPPTERVDTLAYGPEMASDGELTLTAIFAIRGAAGGTPSHEDDATAGHGLVLAVFAAAAVSATLGGAILWRRRRR